MIRLVPAKSALRSVLMSVVSVAAVVLGGPLGGMLANTFGGSVGLWTAAATIGINVLGSLLVNALIPQPQPRDARASDSISGWRNRFEPHGAVPVVMGKLRYAPPFAASSWTETVGDNQYVRALFTFGYGRVQLSEMRLGDTPLDDFGEVEIELGTAHSTGDALALYPRHVIEENIGVNLTRPKPRDDFGEVTSHDGVETPVVCTKGGRMTGRDSVSGACWLRVEVGDRNNRARKVSRSITNSRKTRRMRPPGRRRRSICQPQANIDSRADSSRSNPP